MDTFETSNILYILKYAIHLWYLATVIESKSNPNVYCHNNVEHVLPIYTNTTRTQTHKRKKEEKKIIVQEIQTYAW